MLAFTTIIRIDCNFLIVLLIRLKICKPNVFFQRQKLDPPKRAPQMFCTLECARNLSKPATDTIHSGFCKICNLNNLSNDKNVNPNKLSYIDLIPTNSFHSSMVI